jgi:dephospho-CoA kinase
MVPFVGLTGGMGAGKSTALAALERLGASVISTDAIVHELYRTDSLREEIVERWGEDLAPGGNIDRSRVAARAFAEEGERKWLEGRLWPLVAARVAEWLNEVRSQEPPAKAAVVETPLLFEAGMDGIYDYTIAVIAEEPLRSQRASSRGHAFQEERSSRQLSQEEKSKRATFTVENNGTQEELEGQLRRILGEIVGSAPAQ